MMTPAIGNLVREGKTFRITSELQTGARYGMMPLDSHLLELHKKGIISYEEMISKSYDANYIAQEASAAGLTSGVKK